MKFVKIWTIVIIMSLFFVPFSCAFVLKSEFRVDRYHLGSREYDPTTIQFGQADDFTAFYNPQALNKYSYSLNNPYRYYDKSGNNPLLVTAAAGAAGGAIFSIAVQAYQNNGDLSKTNWNQVGISAVAGGVVGATLGLGTTAGIIGTVGAETALGSAGAAGGVAAQATTNVISGQDVSTDLGEAGVSGYESGVLIGPIDTGIGKLGKISRLANSEPSDVQVVKFEKGMQLNGGAKLQGNRNTAIIHYDLGEGNSMDIHHHNLGMGKIQFNALKNGKKLQTEIFIETGSNKPPPTKSPIVKSTPGGGKK